MIVKRILQVVEYKGISKTKFYQLVGLSNGFLDKVKDVGSSKLELILKAFPEINPNWLLTGHGNMLLEDISIYESKNILHEPGFIYQSGDLEEMYDGDEVEVLTNSNGNKFFIYPDGTIKIEVALMSEPAYAGYVESLSDGSGINLEDLPRTTFKVDRIGKGNYLAFTTKNNSMWNGGGYDTPSGAELLGREVGKHLWSNGFRKTDYGFALLTEKGIYHKDIKEYNKETGMLTLASRNPADEEFKISINDVYQVFNVIKRAF